MSTYDTNNVSTDSNGSYQPTKIEPLLHATVLIGSGNFDCLNEICLFSKSIRILFRVLIILFRPFKSRQIELNLELICLGVESGIQILILTKLFAIIQLNQLPLKSIKE